MSSNPALTQFFTQGIYSPVHSIHIVDDNAAVPVFAMSSLRPQRRIMVDGGKPRENGRQRKSALSPSSDRWEILSKATMMTKLKKQPRTLAKPKRRGGSVVSEGPKVPRQLSPKKDTVPRVHRRRSDDLLAFSAKPSIAKLDNVGGRNVVDAYKRVYAQSA